MARLTSHHKRPEHLPKLEYQVDRLARSVRDRADRYAVSHPGVSSWLSEAAQAELFGTDLGPDLAPPTQLAQPSNQIHSILAQ